VLIRGATDGGIPAEIWFFIIAGFHYKRSEFNTAMSVVAYYVHSAGGLCITLTQKCKNNLLLAILDNSQ
jgi:hypothetical protein